MWQDLYFQVRERVRLNAWVGRGLYLAQNLYFSNFGQLTARVRETASAQAPPQGLALCCRIRDEARYLREWLEYYRAAGVDHVFLYERLSRDDFHSVLAPYIDEGFVSLFEDWPHFPVSPAAERDCILRTLNHFRWVGFLDADEFAVVGDGRSLPDFLGAYENYPAVALHWKMFGSNGHKLRPSGPVMREYSRREESPNRHVKCFVQPRRVAGYRNSHSWYYRGLQTAVTEQRKRVFGSVASPPSAQQAWIHHYHHKSDEDYFEKASRKSVLDVVGVKFDTRTQARHEDGERKSNAVFDDAAWQYYLQRCQALHLHPVLADQTGSASANALPVNSVSCSA